uniref:Uncharacterized protein n=1 Tax=viral metagenome TaxID=1070528 RepID=A0A6C0JUM5_9ZZZZ
MSDPNSEIAPRILWATFEVLASEEQVISSIRATMDEYYEKKERERLKAEGLPSDGEVNSKKCDSFIYITMRGNDKGYVFIQNLLEYNVLAGFNEDGTERVEWIEDPDFVKPEPKPKVEQKPIDFSQPFNWADFDDEDDEDEWFYSKPREIKKELGPLVKLKPYTLTEEQRKYVTEGVTEGYFTLETARVFDTGNKKLNVINVNIHKNGANNFSLKSFTYHMNLFLRRRSIEEGTPAVIRRDKRNKSGLSFTVTYRDQGEGLVTYRMFNKVSLPGINGGKYTVMMKLASLRH